MNPIAPHITAFLRVRLPRERQASEHTTAAYAYCFRMLFNFASTHLGVTPSDLHVEHIDSSLVLAFLEHDGSGKSAARRSGNSAVFRKGGST